jgi:hypothetical protein
MESGIKPKKSNGLPQGFQASGCSAFSMRAEQRNPIQADGTQSRPTAHRTEHQMKEGNQNEKKLPRLHNYDHTR